MEMCLTLIVNILDLLALLSPTALEIQGIPGSLAWCGNLATRALGTHCARPRPRQRLSWHGTISCSEPPKFDNGRRHPCHTNAKDATPICVPKGSFSHREKQVSNVLLELASLSATSTKGAGNLYLLDFWLVMQGQRHAMSFSTPSEVLQSCLTPETW